MPEQPTVQEVLAFTREAIEVGSIEHVLKGLDLLADLYPLTAAELVWWMQHELDGAARG